MEEIKGDKFLRVSAAAKCLGISPSTLRNWDKLGKFVAHRHPINGYRLYSTSDLERLMRLENPQSGGESDSG